jgi:hypothetical protein
VGCISLLEEAPACRGHGERDRRSSGVATIGENNRVFASAPVELGSISSAGFWLRGRIRIHSVPIEPVLGGDLAGSFLDGYGGRSTPDGDREVIADVWTVPVKFRDHSDCLTCSHGNWSERSGAVVPKTRIAWNLNVLPSSSVSRLSARVLVVLGIVGKGCADVQALSNSRGDIESSALASRSAVTCGTSGSYSVTVAKSEPVGLLPGCLGVVGIVNPREVGLEVGVGHEEDAVGGIVGVADGSLAAGGDSGPNGISVIVGTSPFAAIKSVRVAQLDDLNLVRKCVRTKHGVVQISREAGNCTSTHGGHDVSSSLVAGKICGNRSGRVAGRVPPVATGSKNLHASFQGIIVILESVIVGEELSGGLLENLRPQRFGVWVSPHVESVEVSRIVVDEVVNNH